MRRFVSSKRVRVVTWSLGVGGCLVALAIALFLTTPSSHAQPGGWQLNMNAMPNGLTCQNCNTPGAQTGCTAPVPFQWNVGACVVNNAFCCRSWPNYNCGSLYLCANGNVLRACPIVNLANSEAQQNGQCP